MSQFNPHPYSPFGTLSSDQSSSLQLHTGVKKRTVSWGENCLICLQTFSSRLDGGRENSSEIFLRFCQLFDVSVADFQSSGFNSGGDVVRHFCRTCIGDVKGLIALQDQIQEIQKRFEDGVANIKQTIKERGAKHSVTDAKVKNFRAKFFEESIYTVENFVPGVYSTTNTASYQPQHSLLTLPEASPHFDQGINTENDGPTHYEQDENSVEFDNDLDNDAPSDQDINDGKDGSMANFPAPSKPNQRKTKARQQFLALTKKLSQSSQSRTVSSREEFAPIITDAQGRMTYEGYTIQETRAGYICVECGRKCGKQNDNIALRKVKIHIKGYHLKAYQCPICGKNFTSQDIVSQHVTKTHETPPVVCDVCGRSVTKFTLLNHKYTHMNAEEKADFVEAGFKPIVAPTEALYACKTCPRKFKSRKGRKMHERSHLTDLESRKPFKCELCDSRFVHQQNLKQHKATVHGHGVAALKQKMCKICGRMLPTPTSLVMHMRSHLAKEDRPFPCKICGLRMNSLESMKKHEALHDGTEVFNAECDICGKKFGNARSMTLHRRKLHKHHWKPAIPQHLKGDVIIDQPSEGGYLEDLNKEGLQQLNDDLFSYQLYEFKCTPEGFQCCDCGTQIVGAGDHLEEQVKDHVKSTHLGNFVCNICSKRMKNIHEIEAHKRKEHLNEEVLICEVCLKPNLKKRWYKVHLRSHENPRDIAEDINNGAVIHYKNLNRMLRTEKVLCEMGEAPEYFCAVCKEKFTSCQELYNHRKREHPGATKMKRKVPAQEGPFICDLCGKEKPTRRGLANHRRKVHKLWKTKIDVLSFNCSVCLEKFESLNVLISHRKNEHPEGLMSELLKPGANHGSKEKTEETPFGCEICEIWFKSEDTLETHQRKYHRRFMEMLSVTSLICPICKKNFQTLDEVYDHRKSEHLFDRITAIVKRNPPPTSSSLAEHKSLAKHKRKVHRKTSSKQNVAKTGTKKEAKKKKLETSDQESGADMDSENDGPSYSESANVSPSKTRQTRVSQHASKRPRRKVLVVCESDNEDDVLETPYLDMEVKVEENSFEDDVINEEETNSFDYEIKDSPKSIYSDSD